MAKRTTCRSDQEREDGRNKRCRNKCKDGYIRTVKGHCIKDCTKTGWKFMKTKRGSMRCMRDCERGGKNDKCLKRQTTRVAPKLVRNTRNQSLSTRVAAKASALRAAPEGVRAAAIQKALAAAAAAGKAFKLALSANNTETKSQRRRRLNKISAATRKLRKALAAAPDGERALLSAAETAKTDAPKARKETNKEREDREEIGFKNDYINLEKALKFNREDNMKKQKLLYPHFFGDDLEMRDPNSLSPSSTKSPEVNKEANIPSNLVDEQMLILNRLKGAAAPNGQQKRDLRRVINEITGNGASDVNRKNILKRFYKRDHAPDIKRLGEIELELDKQRTSKEIMNQRAAEKAIRDRNVAKKPMAIKTKKRLSLNQPYIPFATNVAVPQFMLDIFKLQEEEARNKYTTH